MKQRILKFIISATFAAVLILLAVSCGDGGKIKGLDAEFTSAFKIEQLEKGIKRVTDGENRELILVPKTLDTIPDEYAGKTVIKTPVERAVFLSTTQVCCLRSAGSEEIWDRIAAVNADSYSFSNIPQVIERMNSGKIINIGGEMGNPDYEQLTALDPDIVFVYTGSYPQTDIITKLEELGINYAVNNEYMELTALARMEWLKFTLTFFNEDKAAADYVAAIKADIEETITKTSEAAAPKILMAYIYDGTVIAVDGQGWLAKIVAEVNGDYLLKGLGRDSLYISVEDFLVYAEQADIILYTSTPSFMPGKTALYDMAPLLKDTPAAQNNRLYEYTDAFWMSVDQPQLLYEDMAQVLHPELYENRTMTYFTLMPD